MLINFEFDVRLQMELALAPKLSSPRQRFIIFLSIPFGEEPQSFIVTIQLEDLSAI